MDGLGHMKKKDVVDSIPFYKVISSKIAKIGVAWEIDKGYIRCYKEPRSSLLYATYIHKPAVFTVLDTGEEGWYAIHVIGETRIDWINVLHDKYMLQEVTLKKLA